MSETTLYVRHVPEALSVLIGMAARKHRMGIMAYVRSRLMAAVEQDLPEQEQLLEEARQALRKQGLE